MIYAVKVRRKTRILLAMPNKISGLFWPRSRRIFKPKKKRDVRHSCQTSQHPFLKRGRRREMMKAEKEGEVKEIVEM